MKRRGAFVSLLFAIAWVVGLAWALWTFVPRTPLVDRMWTALAALVGPSEEATQPPSSPRRVTPRRVTVAGAPDPYNEAIRGKGSLADWPPARETPPDALRADWRATLARVNAALPPTRVRLHSGEIVHCEIQSRGDEALVVRQIFGHSGFARRTLERAEIAAVFDRKDHTPRINGVEFFMASELPDYQVYQNAMETFITDTDYFAVERYDTLLDNLFAAIRARFPELAGDAPVLPGRPARTLTVILHSHPDYAAFFRRHFGEANPPAAFYWPALNALVLFNDSVGGRLTRKDRTDIFRHEATHHFFHRYVLGDAVPYAWFNEGLAEFCADEKMGNVHPEHVNLLKAARDHDALPDAATFYNDIAQFSARSAMDLHVSYALAWATVFTLARSDYTGLIAYLDDMRTRTHPLTRERHEALLRTHLGRGYDNLQAHTIEHITRY